MLTDPYQQYKNTQVGTASPARLLIMLFNGAIKLTKEAAREAERNNGAKVNTCLGKTQDIVAELMASLDLSQGDIAENLFQLYRYMHERLVQANLNKDPEMIREVQGMLEDLRDTWEAASQAV